MESKCELWTIGHSTQAIDDFIAALKSFDIQALVDVRSFPGSRRYPQYNREQLRVTLAEAGVQYFHFPKLGGRRRAKPDSLNMAWRNEMFRGYADYMETLEFRDGIADLLSIANLQRTAFMCAEAVWWRCHRGLIADHLKAQGIEVKHITGPGKSKLHPFTTAARIVDGQLTYRGILDS